MSTTERFLFEPTSFGSVTKPIISWLRFWIFLEVTFFRWVFAREINVK